jgi:hypothetical protein
MKRFLPLCIFLSFLIGYLEWGGGNSGFIFQLEYDAFTKDFHQGAFLHPFILLPLIGQVLLLVSLFVQNRKLIIAGIIFLSVLMLMILLVGVLSLNLKIIASTLPFLTLSVFFLLHRTKPNGGN